MDVTELYDVLTKQSETMSEKEYQKGLKQLKKYYNGRKKP